MLWEKTLCCFIGKGRLYKVLNAGVPIIVAHIVFVNEIPHQERIIFFSEKKRIQLKVGFLSLFQCEIKLIHQTGNFLKPFLLIFANNSEGCSMFPIIQPCLGRDTEAPSLQLDKALTAGEMRPFVFPSDLHPKGGGHSSDCVISPPQRKTGSVFLLKCKHLKHTGPAHILITYQQLPRERGRVRVCLCDRERERERGVCVCDRERERERVCAYVTEREKERGCVRM